MEQSKTGLIPYREQWLRVCNGIVEEIDTPIPKEMSAHEYSQRLVEKKRGS
jgi:hypothetical protein